MLFGNRPSPCYVDAVSVLAVKKRPGFSLIELLVVIAILGVLVAVAVPSLSSLGSGGRMNQALIEMSGLLSQARQYAIAQNTYVWVAFREQNDEQGDPEVVMVILASTSGEDKVAWGNAGIVPGNDIEMLTRLNRFSKFKLEEAGTFTRANIPDLPDPSSADTANGLADNTAKFDVKLPGIAAPQRFDRVVQFLPNGQARVSKAPIDFVEIGVRPVHGTVPEENNVAVVRINGLTGQPFVYRP